MENQEENKIEKIEMDELEEVKGSKSYEIYKEKVGGKTWNGEDMKNYEEMPDNIKIAWTSIDDYYHKMLGDIIKQILDSANEVIDEKQEGDKKLLEEAQKAPDYGVDGNLIFKM